MSFYNPESLTARQKIQTVHYVFCPICNKQFLAEEVGKLPGHYQSEIKWQDRWRDSKEGNWVKLDPWEVDDFRGDVPGGYFKITAMEWEDNSCDDRYGRLKIMIDEKGGGRYCKNMEKYIFPVTQEEVDEHFANENLQNRIDVKEKLNQLQTQLQTWEEELK